MFIGNKSTGFQEPEREGALKSRTYKIGDSLTTQEQFLSDTSHRYVCDSNTNHLCG